MKKSQLTVILIFFIALTFAQHSMAQIKSIGLYVTSGDYLSHKLSYTTDPANPGISKIYVHEFIGQKTVTIYTNGKSQIFDKNKLFGFHDADNKDYRFFDNKSYRIIDTAGFYLYSYDKLIPGKKGLKPATVYYFSKSTGEDILPLTPDNIAKAFPDNTKFRNLVEIAYKSDIKLCAYDSHAHDYKIKEFYLDSFK